MYSKNNRAAFDPFSGKTCISIYHAGNFLLNIGYEKHKTLGHKPAILSKSILMFHRAVASRDFTRIQAADISPA